MGGLFRGSDWRSFHLAISIHCVYVRMSGLGLAWLYTHCIVCAIDLVSYVVDLFCRYAVSSAYSTTITHFGNAYTVLKLRLPVPINAC
jgi:hypothetical protein